MWRPSSKNSFRRNASVGTAPIYGIIPRRMPLHGQFIKMPINGSLAPPSMTLNANTWLTNLRIWWCSGCINSGILLYLSTSRISSRRVKNKIKGNIYPIYWPPASNVKSARISLAPEFIASFLRFVIVRWLIVIGVLTKLPLIPLVFLL